MDPALPEPTAQGTFAKTPWSHLLIYALERGLTGTFELTVADQNVATVLVIQGFPAKLRTTEGIHYLGEVMLEAGLITAEQLAASQERMQESPRLQGQILQELGFATDETVAIGVRAQLERKVEHLFALPPETAFAYFDGVDTLARFGGPPAPVDPLGALWRGTRQAPAWEHVDATLRRVGGLAVRISAHAQLDRFKFARSETAAIELLQQRPMRVVDLANAKVLGPSVAQLLVYCLVITKQVDLVEPVQPPSSPQPGIASTPANTPASAQRPGAPASMPGAGPPSGQAFARVQLQAKTVARMPLVIEEVPVARSLSDNRIASPMPGPIPLPEEVRAAFPASPPPAITEATESSPNLLTMDIGSLITNTIQSSMPPPIPSSSPLLSDLAPTLPPEEYIPGVVGPSLPPTTVASIPVGPPAGTASAPAASSASLGSVPAPASVPPGSPSAPPLTAEQNALKMKILERATGISSQDYFQMLGLERDAGTEAIQKAFIALAKVWHPDRLPGVLADVKDACSKVFTHLTEAHATLSDPAKRQDYMFLIKEGGATPDDQAKIQAVLEAATEFQKAEFLLKRNDTGTAYELAKKAHQLDPEQADYLAMVTWLDAQRPEWLGREKTLEKIGVLDRCIKMNPNCERAYFWRGMLYKRIEEGSKSVKDFKKASELNPRNLDAMREVRLHNMRGGQTKPPPALGGATANRPSQKPPAPTDTIGGLFGKLFKK